jgi:hypothetical protein
VAVVAVTGWFGAFAALPLASLCGAGLEFAPPVVLAVCVVPLVASEAPFVALVELELKLLGGGAAGGALASSKASNGCESLS